MKKDKEVKFNNHVGRMEYELLDVVECSRQRRKRLSIGKESRTWQQLCDDMQWILQCKLGAAGTTGGRAMAMLMDSENEFKDVDEVHTLSLVHRAT